MENAILLQINVYLFQNRYSILINLSVQIQEIEYKLH